jgi:hypothetical protein
MVNRLVTSPLSHCRILRQNHVDPGWRRHPAMGCIITHGLCMNRDGACGPPPSRKARRLSISSWRWDRTWADWFWVILKHTKSSILRLELCQHGTEALVYITVSRVCPSLFSGKGTSSLWQGSWLDAIDVSAWSCWWFQFPCVPSFDRGWPGLILC